MLIAKLKDLTGQTIGSIKVLERIESKTLKNGKKITQYKCKCFCGNVFITSGQSLIQKHTTSCGCIAKKRRSDACHEKINKYIGVKYGNLTVLETYRKDRRTWAKCMCDCGCIHEAVIDALKRGNTSSCGCKKNSSKMENVITKYLIKSNIEFDRQHTFPDCTYKRVLQFDFGLFDSNHNLVCLIECQGIQHYIKQPNGFGDQQREITDPIKKKYCKDNDIKLYEIKYNENPEEILNKIIGECKAILCEALD